MTEYFYTQDENGKYLVYKNVDGEIRRCNVGPIPRKEWAELYLEDCTSKHRGTGKEIIVVEGRVTIS